MSISRPNVVSKLDRRHWSNFKPPLVQRLVLAGIPEEVYYFDLCQIVMILAMSYTWIGIDTKNIVIWHIL